MAVAATSCDMVVVTLTFCMGYRAGLEASAGYYAKSVSPLARRFKVRNVAVNYKREVTPTPAQHH